MRFYYSDQPNAINSVARKPDPVYLPPFNFVGSLDTGPSDHWPVQYDFLCTGVVVTAREGGTGTASLALVKTNIFEQNVPIAIASLAADDLKALFTLEDPLSGALTVSKYDRLLVVSFSESGHKGIVVQPYGVRIN